VEEKGRGTGRYDSITFVFYIKRCRWGWRGSCNSVAECWSYEPKVRGSTPRWSMDANFYFFKFFSQVIFLIINGQETQSRKSFMKSKDSSTLSVVRKNSNIVITSFFSQVIFLIINGQETQSRKSLMKGKDSSTLSVVRKKLHFNKRRL
jgi:hypothetical protein